MSADTHPENDRLMDLLATYAVQELSVDEETELKALLQQEDGVTASEFETAAAAMHLAMSSTNPGLPDGLADKVLSEANAFFLQSPAPAPTAPASPPVETETSVRMRYRERIAWLCAVLSLFLALGGFLPGRAPEQKRPQPAQPTLAEIREALLSESDTVQLAWTATDDPTAVNASGDVVWNTRRREGFMRFSNLKKNDPTEFQYQLWIFESPDQKYPIDGGVFDITDENQLVRINAGIAPSQAVQFAVTIEKPGGVVVSDRERIPLLAAL